MEMKDCLREHFTPDSDLEYRGWIGSEIETHFVDSFGKPISVRCSQRIFRDLVSFGWKVTQQKGLLITELEKNDSKILYELGRQNIELATAPFPADELWNNATAILNELYDSARFCGAFPFFEPIIKTNEDLLVIPDERDAAWLNLDGRDALSLLAKCASLQFTIETKGVDHAIRLLNYLAENQGLINRDNPYPQDSIWREYIEKSHAGYRRDRYGVVRPNNLDEYVELLFKQDAVINGKLSPFDRTLGTNMFIRSVWWNFRLRRYSNRLCVEIRTLPRRTDEQGFKDLQLIRSLICD